jgi:hypothetical protein
MSTVLEIRLLAGRSLRHIPRIPEKALGAVLLPLVFVLLFAYVFRGGRWRTTHQFSPSDIWSRVRGSGDGRRGASATSARLRWASASRAA